MYRWKTWSRTPGAPRRKCPWGVLSNIYRPKFFLIFPHKPNIYTGTNKAFTKGIPSGLQYLAAAPSSVTILTHGKYQRAEKKLTKAEKTYSFKTEMGYENNRNPLILFMVTPRVLPIYPCCFIRIISNQNHYEFYPSKRHTKPIILWQSGRFFWPFKMWHQSMDTGRCPHLLT